MNPKNQTDEKSGTQLVMFRSAPLREVRFRPVQPQLHGDLALVWRALPNQFEVDIAQKASEGLINQVSNLDISSEKDQAKIEKELNRRVRRAVWNVVDSTWRLCY